MRRALLAVLLVAGVAGGWYAYGALAEELPPAHRVAKLLAREDAKTRTQDDDPIYANEAPFDCERSNGDASLEDLVDDVDFVCRPRRNNGERCDDCAGLVVDAQDGRIKEYEQFGGG